LTKERNTDEQDSLRRQCSF